MGFPPQEVAVPGFRRQGRLHLGSWFPESNSKRGCQIFKEKKNQAKGKRGRVWRSSIVDLFPGKIPYRSSKLVSWESEEDEGGRSSCQQSGLQEACEDSMQRGGELQGGWWLELWMDEGSARISWRKIEGEKGQGFAPKCNAFVAM